MLCHYPYACADDCIKYVHARKRQFVLGRELCACAVDYLMHVHTRKHNFVYHSSPFACVEDCVVNVLFLEMPVYALTRNIHVHNGVLMLVHTRKLQFVHF